MVKRYKLLKDLPTFKAGDKFFMTQYGNLCPEKEPRILAYCWPTIQKFPNILKDWFEEISEKPRTVWDLEEGDECYISMLSRHGRYAAQTSWNETLEPDRANGDVFLTKEEHDKEMAWRRARETLRRDASGFEPDWRDYEQDKFFVYYFSRNNNLKACQASSSNHGGVMFRSKEDAEASIKAHPNEWKTYLGVEE